MLAGLRNFFLVFIISLLVFGLSAWALINYFAQSGSDGGAGGDGGGEFEDDGHIPRYVGEFYRFSMLIVGIDDGRSQYQTPRHRQTMSNTGRVYDVGSREADTIIWVDIDSMSQTFRLSYLPRDMRVELKELVLRLGAVYSEFGREALINAVWAYTGLRPDFFVVLDYGSIETIFNVLGDIEFDVPVDMFHMPQPHDYHELRHLLALNERNQLDELNEREEAELEALLRLLAISIDEFNDDEFLAGLLRPEIDLRRGVQMLNGGQIVQLLRFRNFGGGYRHEETARANLHISFLQAVIRQKFTTENFGVAESIYNAVIGSIVETNMRAADFGNFLNTIFRFSEYEFTEIIYPGHIDYQHGVEFFIPNRRAALELYREHRRMPTAVQQQ